MIGLSLLLLPLLLVSAKNPEPVGFKNSFILPNDVFARKWSSTGMMGLDHDEHRPIDAIDEVDLVSKKTMKEVVDDEGTVGTEGSFVRCEQASYQGSNFLSCAAAFL
jgi:hypothetical protein